MSITLKDRVQTITPTKAANLLEYNVYDGQRPARRNRVVEYGEKMLDGRFHIGSVAFAHFKGKTYLLDGQKQLMACVEYETPFRALVQEYTLNGSSTEKDLAKIFSQFNVDDGRTRGDIANAKAASMGWSHWPKTLVRDLASALDLLFNNGLENMDGRDHKATRDQTGDRFAEHIKACEWACGMLSGFKNIKHMRRVPVLTAMIASYYKNHSAATEFWTQVRDGVNLRKDSPAYKVREFLKGSSIYGGFKNAQQKANTSRRAVYAKCGHGWNAFREGRTTDLKYFADRPLPRFI